MLEKAIMIATEAHMGQPDRGNGQPYILHPLRAMLSLNTETERICGVLHEVIEDTSLTLQDLRDKGISEEIITVVDILSKRHKDEDYDAFIGRICRNEIACRVKLADLKDNMDLSRIINPTAQDFERMEKYKRATTRVAEALQSFKVTQPLRTPSHKLIIRSCGATQQRPDDHRNGNVSLGVEIINPNSGFIANEVRIEVALRDSDQKVIEVIDGFVDYIVSDEPFYFGSEKTLREEYHHYSVTAYAKTFIPQGNQTQGHPDVACSNLSIRSGAYGRTCLTGLVSSQSSLNLGRTWLYFSFFKNGVIVGGASHTLDELYAGEERAFVVDLDGAVDADTIQSSYTCDRIEK